MSTSRRIFPLADDTVCRQLYLTSPVRYRLYRLVQLHDLAAQDDGGMQARGRLQGNMLSFSLRRCPPEKEFIAPSAAVGLGYLTEPVELSRIARRHSLSQSRKMSTLQSYHGHNDICHLLRFELRPDTLPSTGRKYSVAF